MKKSLPRRSAKPRSAPASRKRSAVHPAFDRDDHSRRRRDAMVQTAIQAFNRNGFHTTSMDDIAATMGVSKATLYQYYASKTDLLFDCVIQSIESALKMGELAKKEGGTGAQKLERFIALQFSTLASPDGSYWVLIADISALPVPQRSEVRKRSRGVDSMVQGFLEEGIADRSIDPALDPKITGYFVMGSLNWLPRWYAPDGSMRPEDLAREFIRFMLTGVLREPRKSA